MQPDCQPDSGKVSVRYEDPKKHYDFEKKRIGQGGSGAVYRGSCKRSRKMFAIKQTDISKDKGKFAMHEVSVWSAIPQHPNVVGLIEVFVWENYVYAVMELMSSNLASIIPIPKRHMPMLPLLMILRIIRQLICGLLHLHTNHIAHGDIKSDNILLGAYGNVKLADFGVSTQHDEPHFNAPYCGTFSWKPPNAMDPMTASPYKDDIWSFGITIMELFGIDPPFFDVVDQRVLVRLISELRAPPRLPDLENYGDDFRLRMDGLLEVCFYMDPAERFSAEEFLEFFDMIFPDVSSLKN
jgi:serine/threonine protein kinase